MGAAAEEEGATMLTMCRLLGIYPDDIEKAYEKVDRACEALDLDRDSV